MGPDHAPLSKRHGATSVREFREKGYLPEALVNYLALIGWSPGQNEELLPADELARRFRLENVAHSAGVFDEDKLAWANRHYLKVCDADRLASLAEPHLRERGQIVGDLSADARAWLVNVLPGMAASIDRLPAARGSARVGVRVPGNHRADRCEPRRRRWLRSSPLRRA